VPQIDELRSTGLHRTDTCPPGRNAGVPAGGVTAASGKGKQRGLSCGVLLDNAASTPPPCWCGRRSSLVSWAARLLRGGAGGRSSRAASGVSTLTPATSGSSLCRYAPNLRSPMAHSHRVQEEACAVVAGSGRILLDDETQGLRTWDVIRVAPEVVRAFEAWPDGLEIIAFGEPKPEDGDGVRATSTWPGSE
jgi:hypothetical protein